MTNAFSNQWQGLLESLLHRGSSAGADLVEVFLERTDHIRLLAEQERITSDNPTCPIESHTITEGAENFELTTGTSDATFVIQMLTSANTID